MLATMGERPVCVLRGHGVTVTGDTLEQAVVRTLNLNTLATVILAAAQTGRPLPDLPAEDLADLPDLGAAFNDLSVWRYYLGQGRPRRTLTLSGLADPARPVHDLSNSQTNRSDLITTGTTPGGSRYGPTSR